MTEEEIEHIRSLYIIKLKNLSPNDSEDQKNRWMKVINKMPLDELKETLKFLNS